MKLNTSARSATVLWRVVNLMLVACLLFGLGALGTAGGTEESGPSIDPRTTSPRETRESTETAEDEPSVDLERSAASEGAEDAVTRIAEEPAPAREDLESADADAVPSPDPTIVRYGPSGPFTMGDMFMVEATVTVPAGTTLNYPRIREFYDRYGVEYVGGSTQIAEISGTPVSGATLTTGQQQPIVDTSPDGAKFVWRFADPIEAGASDYVFKLSYKVRLTGWNGYPEFWPVRENQQLDSSGELQWWDAGISPPPATRDINRTVHAGNAQTDIDQPRLAMYKNHSSPFTPGSAYPGWYVTFTCTIENTGFSNAEDIYWEDDLPWQLEEPMLLAVEKGSITDISPAPPPGEDIRDQVDADFCYGDPSIDFKDVSLEPDGFINVTYMVWVDAWASGPAGLAEILADGGFSVTNRADVDWSTKPGDVQGERVYNDAWWEDFHRDTDTQETFIDTTVPSFSITKDVAEGTPAISMVGDQITYDMTVTNSGPVTATVVPISDAWDNMQLEFVSATIAPDDIGDYMATWNDLSGGAGLAPGESIDFSATFKAVGGADCVKNRAFIEWLGFSNGTSVGSIDTSSLQAIDTSIQFVQVFQSNVAVAQIKIIDPAATTFVKSADPVEGTIMLPGEKITYTITGSTDVRFNAMITDTLDSSVEYVPGSIRLRSGSYEVTITDDPDDDMGGYDPSTRTVWLYYPFVPTETAGELIFDVVVRDLEFSKQGIQNTAEAYAIPIPEEIDEEIINSTSLAELAGLPDLPGIEEAEVVYVRDSNTVYHPVDPFEITKTGEDLNGGLLVPGDEILWTITVVNTGITPTTNVVVYDTVPEHTTYKADSITGAGADDSGNPDLVWNVGQMPIDGVETVSFISTVDEGTPDGTQIINQAAVESDQSFLTFSDSPTTAATDDATLLQTGQNDWLWLGLTLVAAGLGTALTLGGRKWLKHSE